jgi:L-threonylcarbamoyladenylate synthase
MPQVSFPVFVAGIRSGTLASFPTDTVPALAAHPDRASLIFAAKQRSLEKPLIVMGATIEDLWDYISGGPTERLIWQQVADRHWPGALTLVLPASDRVPPSLNPKAPGTIGVRVPNHAIARAILSQTGPLATTSANRSGQPALQTLAEIEATFPEVLTLAPSELEQFEVGQPSALPVSGTPSTVARWTGTGWEILRQGAVRLDGQE